jgi:hypothetical protein
MKPCPLDKNGITHLDQNDGFKILWNYLRLHHSTNPQRLAKATFGLKQKNQLDKNGGTHLNQKCVFEILWDPTPHQHYNPKIGSIDNENPHLE